MSGDPSAIVEAYLAGLEGETRRVAPGEWGLSVEAAGWPLHVGLAVRDGLLRAQGEAVWIEGDLPLAVVSHEQLDRFLGLLVRVATQAREAAPA